MGRLVVGRLILCRAVDLLRRVVIVVVVVVVIMGGLYIWLPMIFFVILKRRRNVCFWYVCHLLRFIMRRFGICWLLPPLLEMGMPVVEVEEEQH